MIHNLPPGVLLILGGLVLPFFRGRARQAWLLLVPLAGAWHLWHLPATLTIEATFLDLSLNPVRIDALSRVWGTVFHVAAFVSAIYALHVRDPLQHAASLVYAGAAVAAVFAGDLVTLFVFWELTALASVVLIWARPGERSYRAGMRYLLVQVGSGVLLLAGIVLHYRAGGSLAFDRFTDLGLNAPGIALILVAFGIKCAFPLLHTWLPDSYPEATGTGAVWLCAFTTKLAVYALARGFAGAECLIWIGAVMTVYPLVHALLENDLRRVLAYSLMNQLGFMVVGIGIGTELALNGTAAHAFAHVIYKGLLFMSMGAVLLRTGTVNGTDLGGLCRRMPWTAACCVIGAASISGFPLFSGFVSKSMILTAAADEHFSAVWAVLLFAAAAEFLPAGIKVPYLAFFGPGCGRRVEEAPWNMRVAMGLAALLCIGIGILPGALYALLPYPVAYHPYTATHVLTQLQLLLFSALAFTVLVRKGIYPAAVPAVYLDTDWFYRKPLPALAAAVAGTAGRTLAAAEATVATLTGRLRDLMVHLHGPHGILGRTRSTSTMTLAAAILLAAYLLLYYW